MSRERPQPSAESTHPLDRLAWELGRRHRLTYKELRRYIRILGLPYIRLDQVHAWRDTGRLVLLTSMIEPIRIYHELGSWHPRYPTTASDELKAFTVPFALRFREAMGDRLWTKAELREAVPIHGRRDYGFLRGLIDADILSLVITQDYDERLGKEVSRPRFRFNEEAWQAHLATRGAQHQHKAQRIVERHQERKVYDGEVWPVYTRDEVNVVCTRCGVSYPSEEVSIEDRLCLACRTPLSVQQRRVGEFFTKRCGGCGQRQPLTAFEALPTGLRSICFTCKHANRVPQTVAREDQVRAWLDAALSQVACQRCGRSERLWLLPQTGLGHARHLLPTTQLRPVQARLAASAVLCRECARAELATELAQVELPVYPAWEAAFQTANQHMLSILTK